MSVTSEIFAEGFACKEHDIATAASVILCFQGSIEVAVFLPFAESFRLKDTVGTSKQLIVAPANDFDVDRSEARFGINMWCQSIFKNSLNFFSDLIVRQITHSLCLLSNDRTLK